MSKIGKMREMLLDGKKYTKEELAAGSGVALSTVSVQLGYHLKGEYTVHKEVVEGVKRFWMTTKTDAEFKQEAVAEGEEDALDGVEGVEPAKKKKEEDEEPTEKELEEIKQSGLDKIPVDAELEALLDE